MGRHKEWRKLVKKLRRKRIRSSQAEERNQIIKRELEEREKSPTHLLWLKEQETLEAFAEQEERRLAEVRQRQWEADEAAAQERWREQQIRLEKAHAEKAKQELLIREEWEREQKKLQEEKDRKEKGKEEKKKRQEELLAQIDAFILGKAELPPSTVVNTETQPGQPECPFFSKTGACRFRDNCSRNHIRPGLSRILLFVNFYDHFGIQSTQHNEYDTDVSLEYEDSETYHDFLEFYNDILPEFESCGPIRQLKVCCNKEQHLRGNVYVEYYNERHALKAYQIFQGRFYAGRQLSVAFTNIPSWKNALCGLFHKQRCPKGRNCNFLHVFKNPNNAFRDADFDRSIRRTRESPPRRRMRSVENWRWSESPERIVDEHSDRKHLRNSSDNRNNRRRRERSRNRTDSSEKRRDGSSLRKKRRKSKSRGDSKSSYKSHRDSGKSRSKQKETTTPSRNSSNNEKTSESKNDRKNECESTSYSSKESSVHKKRIDKEERTPESG